MTTTAKEIASEVVESAFGDPCPDLESIFVSYLEEYAEIKVNEHLETIAQLLEEKGGEARNDGFSIVGIDWLYYAIGFIRGAKPSMAPPSITNSESPVSSTSSAPFSTMNQFGRNIF